MLSECEYDSYWHRQNIGKPNNLSLCEPVNQMAKDNICKLLTNYVLNRILPKGVSADEYFEPCDFSRENTNIETYRCIIYPCLCLMWWIL
jgi:hypothetical protein